MSSIKAGIITVCFNSHITIKPKPLQTSYKQDSEIKMVQFNDIDLIWKKKNCHRPKLNLNWESARVGLTMQVLMNLGLVPLPLPFELLGTPVCQHIAAAPHDPYFTRYHLTCRTASVSFNTNKASFQCEVSLWGLCLSQPSLFISSKCHRIIYCFSSILC